MIQGLTGWKNTLSESGFPGLKDLQDEEIKFIV